MSEDADEPPLFSAARGKIMRARTKAFDVAFRSAGKGSGWRSSGGYLFRQEGEWFASAYAVPEWRRGCDLYLEIKPMGLDPILWDIMRQREMATQPLSFRVRGAFSLRLSSRPVMVGEDVEDIDMLAAVASAAANAWLERAVREASIDGMLAELLDEEPDAQLRASAICLAILKGDLDHASRLCQKDPADAGHMRLVLGGYHLVEPSGESRSFPDLAREWLVHQRRERMRAV